MLNGIYCIEISDWGYLKNEKTTLAPILQLLKGMDRMPYRYASYSTREELRFQLHAWQRHSRRFPYLYLGAHGEGNKIFCKKLANRRVRDDEVDLTWMAEQLGKGAAGKVIVFGGCSVFDVPRRELARFVKRTGVRAIMGYAEDVDWLEAAAFELLLFGYLPLTKRIGLNSLRAAVRDLKSANASLATKLRFRMIPQ